MSEHLRRDDGDENYPVIEPKRFPRTGEPWWNDKDKVGGLAATVVVILVLALLTAGVIKFLIWLF